jgi:hypothetical protein
LIASDGIAWVITISNVQRFLLPDPKQSKVKCKHPTTLIVSTNKLGFKDKFPL